MPVGRVLAPSGSFMEVGLPKPAAFPLGSVTLGRVLGRGWSHPEPSRSQRQPLSRMWQGEWGPQKAGPQDSGRMRPEGPSPRPGPPGCSPLLEHPLLPPRCLSCLGDTGLSLPPTFWMAWPAGSISRSSGWGGGQGTDWAGSSASQFCGPGFRHTGGQPPPPSAGLGHTLTKWGRHYDGAPQTHQCPGVEEAPLGAWGVQGLRCGGGHPRIVASGECG